MRIGELRNLNTSMGNKLVCDVETNFHRNEKSIVTYRQISIKRKLPLSPHTDIFACVEGTVCACKCNHSRPPHISSVHGRRIVANRHEVPRLCHSCHFCICVQSCSHSSTLCTGGTVLEISNEREEDIDHQANGAVANWHLPCVLECNILNRGKSREEQKHSDFTRIVVEFVQRHCLPPVCSASCSRRIRNFFPEWQYDDYI